jgi:hypothetical protein
VTSLTAIFGSTPERPEEESEKLLNLYWNRAELKKEFAGLRKEQFRLQDLVKQHESATLRVQQKLDHLEHLLLDPEWVYNVVVYYQFRALNLRCQSKVEKFAEQLKQQREQRLHSQQVDQWNQHRAEEAAAVERQIGEQRMEVQLLEDQLQHERHRLATMGGLTKLFRGRSLTQNLDAIAARIDAAQKNEEALLLRFDEIQNRLPPDNHGLDIPTKRTINFMILSFAQQLYLHFSDCDLAGMAKEAGDKSVGAINYGGKKNCDELVARVDKRLRKFEKLSDFADILQQRAKLIAEKALFRSDSDAVPTSGSVATIFDISRRGVVREKETNLLGENYWNLSEILSR